MATKKNPGKFDCYEKAEPDEPMFILLGRDPVAPFLVDLWREIREELKCTEQDRLDEAETCAIVMRVWARGLGKSDKLDAVADALRRKMRPPKPVLACDPNADFK
jgi:hypothetical protein